MAAADDDRLVVNARIAVPRHELAWRFTGSGGPGGQHANTANTKVELRFDIAGSSSLTESVRARLLAKLGPEVRVVVSDERSQARNRALAERRLVEVLQRALHVSRRRVPTRPGRAAAARRIDQKQRRGNVKRLRRSPRLDDS